MIWTVSRILFTLSAATVLAGTALAETPAKPISMHEMFFAQITKVDGKELTIEPVHFVISRDGSNAISVKDQIHAIVEPVKPGHTRVAVCVDTIRKPGAAQLTNQIYKPFPREGCLAQLHEYNGAAGMPIEDIKVGAPVRVQLNGDLVLPFN